MFDVLRKSKVPAIFFLVDDAERHADLVEEVAGSWS